MKAFLIHQHGFLDWQNRAVDLTEIRLGLTARSSQQEAYDESQLKKSAKTASVLETAM